MEYTLSIDLKSFKKNYNEKKHQLIFLKTEIDDFDPLTIFMKISDDKKNSFFYESLKDGELSGRYSVIGIKPDKILKIEGRESKIYSGNTIHQEFDEDPIRVLRNFTNDSIIKLNQTIPSIASGIFGYIGYDFAANIENLPKEKFDELNLPDAILLRPSITVVFDKELEEVIICKSIWFDEKNNAENIYEEVYNQIIDIKEKIDEPRKVLLDNNQEKIDKPRSNFTKEEYFQNVRKARDYIIAGDIFQVVPSQRLSIDFKSHPFLLYKSLREINPSPYMYYIKFEDFFIVGSSPETLVKVEGKKVTINPIAGTRPKEGGKEDEIKKSLLSDPKERAEHLMLLDLGRNDVGRVSKIGSINVKESFQIQETSHLFHIFSTVEGVLDSKEDRISALCAGFPAGTVTGAPKIRAMEIINELEVSKRGVYAGAIGYFSSSGDMDTAIALRTAVIKDSKMYVQVGGGVVYDSDEEYEYNETLNKAKALFSAAERVIKR
ncbi:MAG: anthranilate synthase component I [Pseudomonadota bacterium]|nr:anthranilate synthase component I [Pseudomonadota bacterium]MEC7831230.1 anthranilate synthase component I [Pseudomonadota bacterium]MEC9414013.1 anthranilate synthase component I [Pseudomonadota bacterium]